ncbi:MAG: hypothetical protein AAFO69_00730 [Bacteroidota bacterium]
MKKLFGQSTFLLSAINVLLLCLISYQSAWAQSKKNKVLFITIGDTKDLLHATFPEDFKVKIGEECRKSIYHIEEVAHAIPGLDTTRVDFTGDRFSKKAVDQYLRSNQFNEHLKSATVVICYVVTHGEADTDESEELPIVHFPDGQMRSTRFRDMLQEEGNDHLVLLMVEACNHEPLDNEATYGTQYTSASDVSSDMLYQLFVENTGYIEMVSAARSYKSYVTGNGGLLAYYFRDYMLNIGYKADWAEVRTFLTRTIYTHQPESSWMETLRGGKRVKVENFKPYISLDYLVDKK